ncbi:MAG: hypothetical protein AAF587_10770 [Bacteroidota bacterium]
MRLSQPFLRRRKTIIVLVLASLLLITMTISDIYYSGLERDYPFLAEYEQIDGTITAMKVHHKYSFIEIDSSLKRAIVPTYNPANDPYYFHEFVTEGDRFVYKEWSRQIEIIRDGEIFLFDMKQAKSKKNKIQ